MPAQSTFSYRARDASGEIVTGSNIAVDGGMQRAAV